MRLWQRDNRIADDELWEYLPDQIFPDIAGLALRIEEQALHICGHDACWALQSDLALASGPGCMSFFYDGDLRYRLEGPEGSQDISMAEAQSKDLLLPAELCLIKRTSPWEFVFVVKQKQTMRIFANIMRVSWQPKEES